MKRSSSAFGFAAFLTMTSIPSALAVPKQSAAVSASQKQEFLRLLHSLPHQGEFYTEESVTKAAPYLPVLLALTEKDLDELDLYPFAAISRGLCDRKPQRDYVLGHFSDIRHPKLKLMWAAMLFSDKYRSPEIVRFLQKALQSETQSAFLSEMMGPQFGDFKKQVLAQPSR